MAREWQAGLKTHILEHIIFSKIYLKENKHRLCVFIYCLKYLWGKETSTSFLSKPFAFPCAFEHRAGPSGKEWGLVECKVSSFPGRHVIPFLQKTRSRVFERVQKGPCGLGRCVQFIPVSTVSSSFSLGRILLASAFYAFIFFLARLFTDIKTASMLLSIQMKTENLPFHVKHRALASSKIKKEENVFFLFDPTFTTTLHYSRSLLLQGTQSPAAICLCPKYHTFAYHLNTASRVGQLV